MADKLTSDTILSVERALRGANVAPPYVLRVPRKCWIEPPLALRAASSVARAPEWLRLMPGETYRGRVSDTHVITS